MYERFTDRARKVMQLANQEAQRFNHEYIGTEHILLGLITEGSGVAAHVLRNLDVDLRKARAEVEKIVQAGPDMVTMGKLPPTPRTKKVVEYAIEESRTLNHNYVGTEHLLLGLLREQEGVGAQVLMNLGLRLEKVREEVLVLLGHGGTDAAKTSGDTGSGKRKAPALHCAGRDVTDLARLGKLDPVYGRHVELQALEDVLGCRRRNSPILLGEPGVGKTALVAGLAQAMVARDAPAWLDGCRLVELSLSKVWINLRNETAFDERLKAIFNEVRRSPQIILFLPEALRFLAAPQRMPGLHALHAEWLDWLQPGDMRCILAGTSSEYQRCLSRNIPLERCCQAIPVPPTTVEETLAILRGLCDRYERHHLVRFSEDALAAVARLANVHLPGALPGKAVLLLDRAGARGQRRGAESSRELRQGIARLDDEIERLNREKENAVAEHSFVDAAAFRDQADQLKKEKETLLNEGERRRQEQGGTIDAIDVTASLRDLTGGTQPPAESSHVTALRRPNAP